jgi:hypothetical protein
MCNLNEEAEIKKAENQIAASLHCHGCGTMKRLVPCAVAFSYVPLQTIGFAFVCVNSNCECWLLVGLQISCQRINQPARLIIGLTR